MTPAGAVAFVRKHGVVLASARGPVPNLAAVVAGTPIRGSWWGHPKGREIFQALNSVADSPDVLVCRLVGGKRTFVHRRLWPAIARLAPRFGLKMLARVVETHTVGGHHEVSEVPFADWLPAATARAAARLTDEQAVAALGAWARAGARVPRRRSPGSRISPRTARTGCRPDP